MEPACNLNSGTELGLSNMEPVCNLNSGMELGPSNMEPVCNLNSGMELGLPSMELRLTCLRINEMSSLASQYRDWTMWAKVTGGRRSNESDPLGVSRT